MNQIQQENDEWGVAWQNYLAGNQRFDEEFLIAYNNFTCDYNPEQIRLAHYFWVASKRVNQKYIDLLKDIYYNYDLPNGVDQKIEKLLGDLL